MKSADQWFSEYAVSHQTRINKIIHYICVPAIFFSIIGLLAAIPLGNLTGALPATVSPFVHLGTVLIVAGLVFYFRISKSIFLGMLLVSVLVLLGNHWIDTYLTPPLWIVSLGIFVISWVFQFIGHNHEGKKPSMFQDLQFLLVGPAWILGHLYRTMGVKY